MFRISKDSPAYYLTSVANGRLPIFKTAKLKNIVCKANYIHQNPVRAGLVERAEDYRWSSIRCWQRQPLENEPLLVDINQINWHSSGGAASKTLST